MEFMLPIKAKSRVHHIIIALIFAHLLVVTACLDDSGRRVAPRATEGILDLADWDFKRDGPVDLSGDYEFYWNRHLLPADFATDLPARKTGYIRVPAYWKDMIFDGMKLPGRGYVTYRLNIALKKPADRLGLNLEEISNAYNIYVNGQKVASMGRAGTDQTTTVPLELPQVVDLEIETDRIELIIQASNFHHRPGGAWSVIKLGRLENIRKTQEKRLSFDMFLFGSIFIIALYHLGLFAVHRKDPSPLYFSIFCFLIALRLLTTGGRNIYLFFPQVSWEYMYKYAYASFYLAVPAFGMFMQSIFPKLSERLFHLIAALAVVFSAVVFFTPVRIFSHTLNIYEIITLATLVYGLYVIFVSLPQKRIEAFVFLLGFAILAVAIINDMLHVENIIHTGLLTPFGFFFIILSQSVLLSYRFSSALITVQTQGRELRDTLESYKAEIQERVRAEQALRESEEKYRTILNSIEEGYYEVDLEGNLTFFNDSLRRHLGYSKDELTGMNNRQFMGSETAGRVYKTFNSVFETGRPATAVDWEMIAKDGSKKFVELSVSLMRNSEGRPVGFRGVARDITARKKAEEQARIHQQQLVQASKMVALGTLVSGVAHEINNPNSFIMLNSPILKEAWENAVPILEKYYQENGDFVIGGLNYTEMRTSIPTLFTGISDGAKRIQRIVDELKNYVRDNTTDLDQTVDINDVLKSSVSLLANMIKNPTNRFSVRYGSDLPPVKGNFQRLEQVMINLIQNACQALPDSQHGIFVAVSLDQGESKIVLEVRDEGVGIPRDTLMNVTDPFFTTKHDSGGVGLGLSISSKIVEEHGGSMHFTSEFGAGTTVEIRLPFVREDHKARGITE